MLTGIMSKVTASIKTDTFSDITLSSTEEGRDMTPSSPSRGCVANSHRLTVAVGGEHFVRRGALGGLPNAPGPDFPCPRHSSGTLNRLFETGDDVVGKRRERPPVGDGYDGSDFHRAKALGSGRRKVIGRGEDD